MFEKSVELGLQAQKNLGIDLVLDRDREEDRLEGRRLRFETEGFVQQSEPRLRFG